MTSKKTVPASSKKRSATRTKTAARTATKTTAKRKSKEVVGLEENLKNMKPRSKSVRDRELREFKEGLDDIIQTMSSRITNETNLSDLFHARPDSIKKMNGTYSIYSEKPEEFTKRYLIEPILRMLGYDNIAYETALGVNNWRSDYALILNGWEDGRNQDLVIVEAKSMLLSLNSRNVNGQIDKYLERYNADSLYTPYFGILTDGQIWELHSLKDNGKTVRKWKIDIQPVLRWAYLKSNGENPAFPVSAYRKFVTVFGKENIQLYANCLRNDIKLTMPDESGKIVAVDNLQDREPVKERTRTKVVTNKIYYSADRQNEEV